MKTTSSILAVLSLVLMMVPNDVSAEVQFRSTNYAVFGGKIRLEGGGAKCSARFRKVEKLYDQLPVSRPWSEATAVLPCALPDGGRLVVEVNGKPTGFQIPAGVLAHGRHVYIGVVDIPYLGIPVYFTGQVGKGIIDIEVYPQARKKKCMLRVYTDWPYAKGYEGYIAHKKSYIEEFLARHPLLPCKQPG